MTKLKFKHTLNAQFIDPLPRLAQVRLSLDEEKGYLNRELIK